jgi:hypothetical protein
MGLSQCAGVVVVATTVTTLCVAGQAGRRGEASRHTNILTIALLWCTLYSRERGKLSQSADIMHDVGVCMRYDSKYDDLHVCCVVGL